MRAPLLPLLLLACRGKGGSPEPETAPHDTASSPETDTPGADTDDTSPGSGADSGPGDTGPGDSGEPEPGLARSWGWDGTNTTMNADASFAGEEANEYAGTYTRAAGDLNGDGYNDLAVGAYASSDGGFETGEVYFVFGRGDAEWAMGGLLADSPSVIGGAAHTQLATNYSLGDVNGDGLADVALSTGYTNSAPPDDAYEYLLLGRAEGWVRDLPLGDVDVAVYHENSAGGTDVKSREPLGDMDGDGVQDWLITTQTGINGNGEAQVLSGAGVVDGAQTPSAGALWVYGGEEDVYFSPAGDINGDGLADLYGSAGGVNRWYAFLGSPGGLPHGQQASLAADVTFEPGAQDILLSPVGDLNGDGREDLAGIVPTYGGVYEVGIYVFFGRETWPETFTLDDVDVRIAPTFVPTEISPVGDVNGDGYGDLGYILKLKEINHVYVVFGRASWPGVVLSKAADVHITPAEDMDGLALPTLPHQRGDLDGDGRDDLFLADSEAPWNGENGAGALFVFAGREEWPADLNTADADAAFGGFGQLQRVGEWFLLADLNADARDDLVVSCPTFPWLIKNGEVYVFLGQPRP